ncbi:hypothetical protein Javan253_0026 [Streptococcus phage Javan253]|uniref:hypothetical protein n=1 Tax=Streptococcus henryi TaxID=439219 RepID=UPI00036E25B9|nr:hypothetical protein [Streptococcus henryi]QBX16482.1 hypothetical protein Javan253_0026 [Streptococcus phage Javan253]
MTKEKIYALYKGDNFIADGTVKEIAQAIGVKPSTVQFYASPCYARRTSEKKGLRLIKIEE